MQQHFERLLSRFSVSKVFEQMFLFSMLFSVSLSLIANLADHWQFCQEFSLSFDTLKLYKFQGEMLLSFKTFQYIFFIFGDIYTIHTCLI